MAVIKSISLSNKYILMLRNFFGYENIIEVSQNGSLKVCEKVIFDLSIFEYESCCSN